MQTTVMFDLNQIQKVFKETQTYFSPQLSKDYEELLQFNRTITTERSKFLKQQIKRVGEGAERVGRTEKRER